MQGPKRTKDLTAEEILQFKRSELKHWMERVLARLYKLLDGRYYAELAAKYVAICSRGIEHAKRGLIELVKVVQKEWLEPAQPTHLHVVR